MTTSSGKHFEDVSHAHIISLMYELVISAEVTDDLSVGLDRHRNRRQQELTNNKEKVISILELCSSMSSALQRVKKMRLKN